MRLLPLLILLPLFSVAQNPENISSVKTPARFPGGTGELMIWVNNNLQYPEEAIDNLQEGIVFVAFVVDENGEVDQPWILRGVSPELNNAAVAVIESMPIWVPARDINDQPVSMQCTVPVHFRLELSEVQREMSTKKRKRR